MQKIDLGQKTLPLVAGPSGAGKTVFINQYRSGTLAPELTRLLPANGERWPQIGANDCLKRGVGIDRVLPRDWPAPFVPSPDSRYRLADHHPAAFLLLV